MRRKGGAQLQRDGRRKAGLESTVRYLASNLGSRNIRVNAISAAPSARWRTRRPRPRDMLKSHADARPAPQRRQLEVGGAHCF